MSTWVCVVIVSTYAYILDLIILFIYNICNSTCLYFICDLLRKKCEFLIKQGHSLIACRDNELENFFNEKLCLATSCGFVWQQYSNETKQRNGATLYKIPLNLIYYLMLNKNCQVAIYDSKIIYIKTKL